MIPQIYRSTTTSANDKSISKADTEDVDENIISKANSTSDAEKNSVDRPHDVNKTIRPYTGFRWFLVCVAVFSSAFLYGLDNTIVADIQANAIETFGAVEKIGWLGIGFPLGGIAMVLSLGKAYSIFDVKWMYIASLIMFEAGSALCGGAPSMNALIVGRVWAGAGGAGMVSASQSMCPYTERC